MSDQVLPLTPAEIAHFLQEGFLVKRGVLHPEQCAVARNRLWASNRSKKLRRDDAATWIGGFPPDDRQVDISGLNDRGSQFLWRLRELAGDLELIQLLPLRAWLWLEQLVGEDELVEPRATSIPGDRDPGGIRLRGHNMYTAGWSYVACAVCYHNNKLMARPRRSLRLELGPTLIFHPST